ncbi:MAG: hypothetical protein OXG85_11905, partial [Chloroflexi bacterium]|nr:hypothetical protein [Chloroflexota bacterium]
MFHAKRAILVFVMFVALLSVLSPALAQDEELVFGNLPRSETFIVASQAPHNDVWDSFNYYQAPTYNNATGFANVILEPAFITSHGFHAWLAQSWEYNEDGTEMT